MPPSAGSKGGKLLLTHVVGEKAENWLGVRDGIRNWLVTAE
jgi:hypothetical protein